MADGYSMETMLAMTAIGAALGLRFKVFVLAPTIAISLAISSGVGTGHGNGSLSIVFATFLAITALQVGYLAGTVVRFGVARARARKDPAGTVTVP
jgi:hypothetical protein